MSHYMREDILTVNANVVVKLSSRCLIHGWALEATGKGAEGMNTGLQMRGHGLGSTPSPTCLSVMTFRKISAPSGPQLPHPCPMKGVHAVSDEAGPW